MIIKLASERFQPGDIATLILHEVQIVDNPADATKKRLEVKFKEDGGERVITLSLRLNPWADPTKLYAGPAGSAQKNAEARFKAYSVALSKYKDARKAAEDAGLTGRDLSKAVKNELKSIDGTLKELGVSFLSRQDFDKFMSYWMGAVNVDPMSAGMVTDGFTGVKVTEHPEKPYTVENFGDKKYIHDPNVTGKPSLTVSIDEGAYLKSLAQAIRNTLLGTKAQVMICGEMSDGNVYSKLLVPPKTITVLPEKASDGDVNLHFKFDPSVHIVQGYSKNAAPAPKPEDSNAANETSEDALPF